MVELEVLNHATSFFHGQVVAVNPSQILMVRDGRKNLGGQNYVEVLFSEDIRKTLSDTIGSFAPVKGTYMEILKKISES